MPLDAPSNILSLIANPNPVQGYGPDLNTINQSQNAFNNNQRTQIAVQQQAAAQQSQNALKMLYSNPQNFDPKTLQPTPEAFSTLMRIAPQTGMDLSNNLAALQEKQARQTFQQGEIAEQYGDRAQALRESSLKAYNEYLKTMPPDAAMQKVQADIWNPGIQDLKLGMPPSLASQVQPTFDPVRVRQADAAYTNVKTMQDQEKLRLKRQEMTDEAALDLKKQGYEQSEMASPDGQVKVVFRAPGKPTLGVDGRPIADTGMPVPKKSEQAEMYEGTVDGKPTRLLQSAGGWTTPEGRAVPDSAVSGIHKVGTKDETVEKFSKPQMVAIPDPDNPSETKQVPAQQILSGPQQGQWVSADAERTPMPTPTRIMGAGSAGGGRETQQAMRMINAGNEAAAAVTNLTELPISATSGWFKGLTAHTPDSLSAAIGRSMAGYVNDSEARALQLSWQGVGRAMAALETAGAGQGLVGLTKQADTLLPQKGDTNLNVMRSYAEIRQIVERSVETIKSSPGTSADQKKLLDKIVDQTKEAVPWTVHDVNMLETGGKNSVRDFARQVAGNKTETPIAPAAAGNLPKITGDADYAKVPSGQQYVAPDGSIRMKP
jgi:hypothetical protein